MERLIARDAEGFARDSYDLLVVGGGVYGVMLALESARRGSRPLLLERADFGGATSWNSLRIVHGGLRYLQTLDLRRYAESVAERRWFLRHFPDLVAPLPCMMPLYDVGLKRAEVFRIALAANDVLSWSRNRGVGRERRIPGGGVVSTDRALELAPSLRRAGLRGAAVWHDASMLSSVRLLIEALRWACAAGARALNYVEAERLLVDDGVVAGLHAMDHITGRELTFRAPVVVNCAGPWSAELVSRFDRPMPELFRPSVAFNILLGREPPSSHAVAVAASRRGAGTYFVTSARSGVLAGTFHAPAVAGGAEAQPSEEHVLELLADLRDALPGWAPEPADVRRIHAGVLPATDEATAQLTTRPAIVVHGAEGGPRGLYSVAGVKFTTARRVAAQILRRVRADRGERMPEPVFERPDPNPVPTLREFAARYGDDPTAGAAWLDSLRTAEGAVTAEDLVYRRLDWGGDPDAATRALELVRSGRVGSGA